MSVAARAGLAAQELAMLASALDEAALDRVVAELDEARRIFLTGQGRSGLMLRAVAIRLMHVGLAVHVAAEPGTPAIGPGDLLVAATASARTLGTLQHLDTARRVGARTLLLTASADPPPSDLVLRLPVRDGVATAQHAGSLFEQGILVIGDALAHALQTRRRLGSEELDARHANLQ